MSKRKALKFFLSKSPHYMKLKGGRFRPAHVKLKFENKTYLMKTIDHVDELDQVLRLRFNVFFNEFATYKPPRFLMPYDVDGNDFKCDHLIIKEKSSGKIVACYRVVSSKNLRKVARYYTEGEFNLDEFLKLPGHKLELGRACVHKDHRTGVVIRMLWRGLTEYAALTQTKFMFGCSSVARKEFETFPALLKSFEENKAFIENYDVKAQPAYDLANFPDLNLNLTPAAAVNPKSMNSLLGMYIMAGAKIGRSYAYDKEMDCVDIFTVIDCDNINPAFDRRIDNGPRT